MSQVSLRRARTHALAAATALALSSMVGTALAGERLNLSGLQSAERHDRFIVKYRDGSAERSEVTKAKGSLNRAAAAGAGGKSLKLRHLRRLGLGAEVVKSDRKLDRVEAESLMREIAADPNVEYVEVDRILVPYTTPNDTQYSQQWGFNSATAGIRAESAWDKATGEGVVVAVIDTGITSHSDLNANVLPGYDFIDDAFVGNDGDGRDADASDPGDWVLANECGYTHAASNSSWHGSHVAGTIAAVTNNAQGVAGTAYNAKIVPVRVLGKCGGYTSDIADGITWASGGTVAGVPANPNPAEVINMSLGGQSPSVCDNTSKNALAGAVGRGSIVVVAAGNSNAPAANYTMANCGNVIVVGSITSTGARSSFSNYGSTVDIAAPGSAILSTLNTGTTTPGSESYASYSGTSMASPHVAGVAALVQSAATTPKTHDQMRTLLRNSARAFPSTPSQTIGTGIVDANAAVDAANAPPPVTQTYVNDTDYAILDKKTVNSPITVSGRSGNAPVDASISVNIVHTYKGNLKVDLVAPDGTLYGVHNRTGGSADNIIGTYTGDLSAETMNGTWKLRVYDAANGNTGYINSWSITF